MTDAEFRALVAAGPAVVMVEKGHMVSLLDERDWLAADVARMRKVLRWLDALGGLGYPKHDAIRAALAPPRAHGGDA